MTGGTLNINTKAVRQNSYDVIVTGSGISGGWVAKELTERDGKDLMLEWGRNVEPVKDHKIAGNTVWDHPHCGAATLTQRAAHPGLSSDWAAYGTAAPEPLIDYRANEIDCPYGEIKPFTGWRSYQPGGRSFLWGHQSCRWLPPRALTAKAADLAVSEMEKGNL